MLHHLTKAGEINTSIYLNSTDRTTVDKWMKKFLDPKASTKKLRNIYLSFLVFQIQNFQICEPFSAEPPTTIVAVSKHFSASWEQKFDFDGTKLRCQNRKNV